jgi:hypothetical protein
MTELTWRKSSFSGSQANCVEIATSDHVLVRDTKSNSGAVLRFTPAAWRKFADQVKRSLALGFAVGGFQGVHELAEGFQVGTGLLEQRRQ